MLLQLPRLYRLASFDWVFEDIVKFKGSQVEITKFSSLYSFSSSNGYMILKCSTKLYFVCMCYLWMLKGKNNGDDSVEI